MKTIRIKRLRAHHVANLYLNEYLKGRDIETREIISRGLFIMDYPIEVIDTTDDYCEECKQYPEINFCRGQKIRAMDLVAAEKLGLVFGKRYLKRDLIKIFEARKKKDKIRRNSEELEKYVEDFY